MMHEIIKLNILQGIFFIGIVKNIEMRVKETLISI